MKRQKCGPGKRIVSAVIPSDVYAALGRLAAVEGISVSAYCARVLVHYYRTGGRITLYQIPATVKKAAESGPEWPGGIQPLAPGCCPAAVAAMGDRGNGGGGEG